MKINRRRTIMTSKTRNKTFLALITSLFGWKHIHVWCTTSPCCNSVYRFSGREKRADHSLCSCRGCNQPLNLYTETQLSKERLSQFQLNLKGLLYKKYSLKVPSHSKGKPDSLPIDAEAFHQHHRSCLQSKACAFLHLRISFLFMWSLEKCWHTWEKICLNISFCHRLCHTMDSVTWGGHANRPPQLFHWIIRLLLSWECSGRKIQDHILDNHSRWTCTGWVDGYFRAVAFIPLNISSGDLFQFSKH